MPDWPEAWSLLGFGCIVPGGCLLCQIVRYQAVLPKVASVHLVFWGGGGKGGAWTWSAVSACPCDCKCSACGLLLSRVNDAHA